MNTSNELKKFQERCHQYFTCFTFATKGLENVAEKFKPYILEDQDPKLFIGSGHPDEGKAHSKISLKDAVIHSQKNGMFSDMIAKAIIVTIYSEWDELYRHKIAHEVNLDSKNVASDLMGDLRIVRHWIVHNKSVIDKDHTKIKILPWPLRFGEELKISNEMFSSLIDMINVMKIVVHAN